MLFLSLCTEFICPHFCLPTRTLTQQFKYHYACKTFILYKNACARLLTGVDSIGLIDCAMCPIHRLEQGNHHIITGLFRHFVDYNGKCNLSRLIPMWAPLTHYPSYQDWGLLSFIICLLSYSLFQGHTPRSDIDNELT